MAARYEIPDAPLGYPTTNEYEALPSPSGHTGRGYHFEKGEMAWDGNNGRTFEVHGSVWNTYLGMGGTSSWLGFPISDEHRSHFNSFCNCYAAYSAFEGGCISWNGVGYAAAAYGSPARGSNHGIHGDGP